MALWVELSPGSLATQGQGRPGAPDRGACRCLLDLPGVAGWSSQTQPSLVRQMRGPGDMGVSSWSRVRCPLSPAPSWDPSPGLVSLAQSWEAWGEGRLQQPLGPEPRGHVLLLPSPLGHRRQCQFTGLDEGQCVGSKGLA